MVGGSPGNGYILGATVGLPYAICGGGIMPRGRPRKEADAKYPKRAASREASLAVAESQASEGVIETGAEAPETPVNDIGLTPDPEPATPEAAELDTYVCLSCHTEVQRGDEKCSVCERILHWEAIE